MFLWLLLFNVGRDYLLILDNCTNSLYVESCLFLIFQILWQQFREACYYYSRLTRKRLVEKENKNIRSSIYEARFRCTDDDDDDNGDNDNNDADEDDNEADGYDNNDAGDDDDDDVNDDNDDGESKTAWSCFEVLIMTFFVIHS